MSDRVPYELEKVIDGVEIRRYPPVVLATVRQARDNEAFGILFRYISGHNRSPRTRVSQPIPMTAPVFSDDSSFSFAMPASYAVATTPVPLDPRSVIEEIPGRRLAVLRFSGAARRALVETRTNQLLDTLARHHVHHTGSPFLMRYDPPFKPGFLRRNEVAVELHRTAARKAAA